MIYNWWKVLDDNISPSKIMSNSILSSFYMEVSEILNISRMLGEW